MEYVASCPNCQNKTIVESKHQIKPKNGRLQRMVKCASCHKVKRQTIIGAIIGRFASKDAKFIGKREFAGKIDSLTIHFFQKPLNVLASCIVS